MRNSVVFASAWPCLSHEPTYHGYIFLCSDFTFSPHSCGAEHPHRPPLWQLSAGTHTAQLSSSICSASCSHSKHKEYSAGKQMFPNTTISLRWLTAVLPFLNSPTVPSGQNVPSALLRVEAEKHVGHCRKHTGSSSLLCQSGSPKRFDKWKTFYNSFDIKAWPDLTSCSNTICPELTRGYFGSSRITVSVNFHTFHGWNINSLYHRVLPRPHWGCLHMIRYIYLFTHPGAKKNPKLQNTSGPWGFQRCDFRFAFLFS